MRRAWICFGLCTLLTVPQAARSQPAAPPPPPQDVPVFEEAIDVRVVNVEVVVTGEDGKPVRGLAPADFRLLMDGREVALEYFSEIVDGRAAASAPAAPGGPAAPLSPIPPSEAVPRSYLLFIDDSFSMASPRNQVLERLAADLSLLGPEDRMAVLAFDGRKIDVLSPWSTDRAALTRALENARDRPARGHRMISAQRSMTADMDVALVASSLMENTPKLEQAMVGSLDEQSQRLVFTVRDATSGQTLWGETQLSM